MKKGLQLEGLSEREHPRLGEEKCKGPEAGKSLQVWLRVGGWEAVENPSEAFVLRNKGSH